MATLEHIEERVYRPDREDTKTVLEKEGILRFIAYSFCLSAIVGSLLMLIGKSNSTIDLLARASFILILALFFAIATARTRDKNDNERKGIL